MAVASANMEGPRWLGTVAASSYLGVTPRTLYRLIDQDRIPAYQMGRVIRLKGEDLEAYLLQVRIKPGALRHLHPEISRGDDQKEPEDDPALDALADAEDDVSGEHRPGAPTKPRMRVSATVLGAEDANALASFYQQLLGWVVAEHEPEWLRLLHPSGAMVAAGLMFAHEPNYSPAVWPIEAGAQQMMAHLDISVDDLNEGVAWAIDCGAVLAEHQPQEHVRVMFDPAGHPFCLCLGPV